MTAKLIFYGLQIEGCYNYSVNISEVLSHYGFPYGRYFTIEASVREADTGLSAEVFFFLLQTVAGANLGVRGLLGWNTFRFGSTQSHRFSFAGFIL